MLFQWVEQVGSRATVVHDYYAKVGAKVMGLRHNNLRPSEIVLTRHELWQLLQNRDYADNLLSVLADGKRATKSKPIAFRPMSDQEYLDDKGA